MSHSLLEVEAQPVGDSQSFGSIEDATEIVGIDEGQFFDDGLIEVCEGLALGGKQVIVAGLDLDYLGYSSTRSRDSPPGPSTSPRCWPCATAAVPLRRSPSG